LRFFVIPLNAMISGFDSEGGGCQYQLNMAYSQIADDGSEETGSAREEAVQPDCGSRGGKR
jgi:hypothetical protein